MDVSIYEWGLKFKKAFNFILFWASQSWNKSTYLWMNLISFYEAETQKLFARLSDIEKLGLTPAIFTTFGWVINSGGNLLRK